MRAVLDTNVFVSAVLFKGNVSRLVDLWRGGKFAFLISGSILKEYIRVLAYRRFKLTDAEIRTILDEQLLPFVETVKTLREFLGIMNDREDEKFLICAKTGKADCIVSGDSDLLQMRSYKGIPIVSVGKFIEILAEQKSGEA